MSVIDFLKDKYKNVIPMSRYRPSKYHIEFMKRIQSGERFIMVSSPVQYGKCALATAFREYMKKPKIK